MRYRRRTGHPVNNRIKDTLPANTSITDPDALSPDIQSNLNHIRAALGNSTDIVIREIPLDEEEIHYIAIVYTDGLADQKIISESIMMVVADIAKIPGQGRFGTFETIRRAKDIRTNFPRQ